MKVLWQYIAGQPPLAQPLIIGEGKSGASGAGIAGRLIDVAQMAMRGRREVVDDKIWKSPFNDYVLHEGIYGSITRFFVRGCGRRSGVGPYGTGQVLLLADRGC